MIGKKSLLFLVLSVWAVNSYGQDGIFTQVDEIKTYYNPALVGSDEYMHFTLANKMQWVGMPGAPTSFMLTLDSPIPAIPRGHGVGITALSETIGMFTNTAVSLQYSYTFFILGGKLAAGLQAGILNQKVDASKAFIPGSSFHTQAGSDPNIPTGEAEGMAFDASLGLFYSYQQFGIGVSVAHLLAPTIELNEKSSVKTPPILYLNTSYDFLFDEGRSRITPSLFCRTDFQLFQPQIAVKAMIKDLVFCGVNYRWNESVGVMLGFEFSNFRVGYSYDILTSAISRASSGSHELFLSYKMKLNLSPKQPKTERKGVRLL